MIKIVFHLARSLARVGRNFSRLTLGTYFVRLGATIQGCCDCGLCALPRFAYFFICS
jgi:predicted molibdopterin-dependent oxidoreductase YjgC